MRRFQIGIFVQVLIIAITTMLLVYFGYFQKRYIGAAMFVVLILVEIYQLYRYVERTNRKLSRFLDAIRFADFETGFVADNQLGKGFTQLNESFNRVLDAFRETRAQSEESLQYLDTVVQHIGIGVVSFDEEGKIALFNRAASQLLQATPPAYIDQLSDSHPQFVKTIKNLPAGSNALVRNEWDQQLAVYATEVRLRDKNFQIISLQNIQKELDGKELEAWQNLAVALRHEIVNSITPIASMTATLNEIIDSEAPKEGPPVGLDHEVVTDIREALSTIHKRSEGLIHFVNAYKNFTRLPEPQFATFMIRDFFSRVQKLVEKEIKDVGGKLEVDLPPENLSIHADEDLLEMVLLNLLKNARDAIAGKPDGKIQLQVSNLELQQVEITVTDNGPGIIAQAIDKIFIPFYSTKIKKGGTGIGLSISRQIIQMHGGSLTVSSVPNEETIFRIRL